MSRRFVWFALVLFSVFVVGCSGPKRPEGMPKLLPCTITLTQGGKPVEMTTVVLRSESPLSWPIMGSTGQTGTAVIFTGEGFQGVPQGTYKVVLIKEEQDKSKLGPTPPETSPEYEAYTQKAAAEVLNTYSLVDVKYTRAETTELTVSVEPGKSAFQFELGQPVRVKVR